jgi:hypothetical protein
LSLNDYFYLFVGVATAVALIAWFLPEKKK